MPANPLSVVNSKEYTMTGLAKAHISFMLAKSVKNQIVIVVSNLKFIMV